MKDQRVESTDELPMEAEIGHDLIAGLKILKAPVALFGLKQIQISTSHDRAPQQQVAPKDLHQALRYGIPTTQQAETSAEIVKLMDWLERKFNEGT